MKGRIENRVTGFHSFSADSSLSDYHEERSSTFLRNVKLSHILTALSPTSTITVDLNPVDSFLPIDSKFYPPRWRMADSPDILTLYPITNGSTT
jgi:hypothetical protein